MTTWLQMDEWGNGLEVMGSRDGIMTTESPSAALGNLPHTRPQGPSTPRTNNARKMQVQIQIQQQIQIHVPRGPQRRASTTALDTANCKSQCIDLNVLRVRHKVAR